jgi:hypothetical protein
MVQDQIAQAVMEDKLGALQVDISVPDHLMSKFSEMTPMFKNLPFTGLTVLLRVNSQR